MENMVSDSCQTTFDQMFTAVDNKDIPSILRHDEFSVDQDLPKPRNEVINITSSVKKYLQEVVAKARR